MKIKIIIPFILVTLVSVLITSVVYAASVRTYPYYVGTSTARAESISRYRHGIGGVLMCESVGRVMNPATHINVIGFTHRACTLKCRRPNGSEYIRNQIMANSGEVLPGGGAYIHRFWELENRACASNETKILVSESWHDFNHTGSPIWRPKTTAFFYPPR